jgi:hypothetical protein
MNVKVRVVLVSLALLSFSIVPAHACVTSSDMSGGGWETSAAVDPCTGIRPATLQGQANASPTYVAFIHSGRPHALVSLESSKHHRKSLFFVPFLALYRELNRTRAGFSGASEIQAMLEARL